MSNKLKFITTILLTPFVLLLLMSISNLIGCGYHSSGDTTCKCYGIKTNIDILGFKNQCIGPSKNVDMSVHVLPTL